jgi:bifunctional DNase/RNase
MRRVGEGNEQKTRGKMDSQHVILLFFSFGNMSSASRTFQSYFYFKIHPASYLFPRCTLLTSSPAAFLLLISLQGRPATHDLMKNMLEALGYRVTKIRISALVGNTYHARVHFGRKSGIKSQDGAPSSTEIDIDARPSDALNLAVRFGAPIYVNKDVAAKMSLPSLAFDERHVSAAAATGSHATAVPSAVEITNSCREEILQYIDPTIMDKLQLQLAIAEERFEEASRLRDAIEKTLASDRALALVVAMETALEDQRFEEAARLRDEFKKHRVAQIMNENQKETSDVYE